MLYLSRPAYIAPAVQRFVSRPAVLASSSYLRGGVYVYRRRLQAMDDEELMDMSEGMDFDEEELDDEDFDDEEFDDLDMD